MADADELGKCSEARRRRPTRDSIVLPKPPSTHLLLAFSPSRLLAFSPAPFLLLLPPSISPSLPLPLRARPYLCFLPSYLCIHLGCSFSRYIGPVFGFWFHTTFIIPGRSASYNLTSIFQALTFTIRPWDFAGLHNGRRVLYSPLSGQSPSQQYAHLRSDLFLCQRITVSIHSCSCSCS